jgi:Transcription-repair coupling factor (superfamily II helicase)
VFIVNDRVQTIYTLAEEIEALVPQARIAVAHGQMDDHDLERVMDAFLSRKFDVLVSTSIIESGLDVPNANTIIIVNAHHFGISQLYQMRGRVGRSSVLAKALLVIPARGEISQESMTRLKALEQFTDLGSGYQLAMRDLEIRGAGNLLGQEQHGFIAEVGFETYVRLVKEAVEALRGGSPLDKPIQPRVELAWMPSCPKTTFRMGLHVSRFTNVYRAPVPLPKSTASRRNSWTASVRCLLQRKCFWQSPKLGFWLDACAFRAWCSVRVCSPRHSPSSRLPRLRVVSEMTSLCPFPIRILGSTPMQAVIELGNGTPNIYAEKALEAFRAFAAIEITPAKL